MDYTHHLIFFRLHETCEATDTGGASERTDEEPLNKGLQRKPLRALKIGAFLKAGIGSTAFPIYGAPLMPKPLGRNTPINAGCVYNVQERGSSEDKEPNKELYETYRYTHDPL